MPKKTPAHKLLAISVHKPCSENWEAMEASANGRFCAACQKTVIDFTGLTDKELLAYFSSAEKILCGRFHPSQLNRNIVPPEAKQKLIPLLYKRIAAVLAFLSLKQTALYSQTQPQTTVQPRSGKTASDTLMQSAVITGSVKSVEGAVLEGAIIRLNGGQVATADKEGRFSFEMAAPLKTAVLNFEYPELVTVARSYHPAMGSTSYNVALDKPFRMELPVVMGIFSQYSVTDSLAIFCFKKGIVSVDQTMRNTLASLANELKNNPEGKINLVGHATKESDRQLARRRQEAMKTYLMDVEGISGERIGTSIRPYTKGMGNTILISQDE